MNADDDRSWYQCFSLWYDIQLITLFLKKINSEIDKMIKNYKSESKIVKKDVFECFLVYKTMYFWAEKICMISYKFFCSLKKKVFLEAKKSKRCFFATLKKRQNSPKKMISYVGVF